MSSGRPDAFFGSTPVICAPLAASLIEIETSSTVPAPSTASGAAEFGLIAMIGVPLVTLALTV